MSTVETTSSDTGGSRAHVRPIGKTRWRRLILGQTAIDFWGRRRLWMTISLVLLAISAVSLWQRGLELGIDFEGGVAWDVPADQLTIDGARDVLEDAGIPADQAKIQERTSDSGNIIKVQVGDQPEAVRVQLQEAFATAA